MRRLHQNEFALSLVVQSTTPSPTVPPPSTRLPSRSSFETRGCTWPLAGLITFYAAVCCAFIHFHHKNRGRPYSPWPNTLTRWPNTLPQHVSLTLHVVPMSPHATGPGRQDYHRSRRAFFACPDKVLGGRLANVWCLKHGISLQWNLFGTVQQ